MLGLDNYSSSDEEDRNDRLDRRTQLEAAQPPQNDDARNQLQPADRLAHRDTALSQQALDAGLSLRSQDDHLRNATAEGPPVGPMARVGPSMPVDTANGSSRSASPYALSRSLIRDLTLPAAPNLDIPPSPPGTPNASTSAKFEKFLELKKQGSHFNEKLAKSSALKNPSMLTKLMDFAGISEQEQYATSLPKEIWDPTAFPPLAYKEELAMSQKDILRRREDEKRAGQRRALDFVPASAEQTGASTTSARGPTDPARPPPAGRSAAERIMAGLDRERPRTPTLPNGDKRRQTASGRRGD